MIQYFYTDGSQNFGPFSIDELKTKNITPETYVWHSELGDWKKAGTLNEFNGLFVSIPPPPPTITPPPPPTITPPPPPIQNTNQAPAQVNFTGTSENVLDGGINSSLPQPPKTWLVESILVTLFCCLPFGIAGIVNASKVESAYNRGNYEEALRASKNAVKWTKIGFFGGLIFSVLYFVTIVFASL